METVNGKAGGAGMEDGFFLSRIYERPGLARELSRGERVTAFSQLMMIAGPIMAALVEETERSGGLRTPDFEFADDFWTVKETAAKLRVNPRTLYAGIQATSDHSNPGCCAASDVVYRVLVPFNPGSSRYT
jgi:hypothetical protein